MSRRPKHYPENATSRELAEAIAAQPSDPALLSEAMRRCLVLRPVLEPLVADAAHGTQIHVSAQMRARIVWELHRGPVPPVRWDHVMCLATLEHTPLVLAIVKIGPYERKRYTTTVLRQESARDSVHRNGGALLLDKSTLRQRYGDLFHNFLSGPAQEVARELNDQLASITTTDLDQGLDLR